MSREDRPNDPWTVLHPLLLRNSRISRLRRDHLLVCTAAAPRLIDCDRSLFRDHPTTPPKRIVPTEIEGDVLFDNSKRGTTHRRRAWELLEQLGQAGIFIEVSALETDNRRVLNAAYDRDDAIDGSAFMNGGCTPVSDSVDAIIRALSDSEPRILELAAIDRLNQRASLSELLRETG